MYVIKEYFPYIMIGAFFVLAIAGFKGKGGGNNGNGGSRGGGSSNTGGSGPQQ